MTEQQKLGWVIALVGFVTFAGIMPFMPKCPIVDGKSECRERLVTQSQRDRAFWRRVAYDARIP